jgi:hypothetical protein
MDTVYNPFPSASVHLRSRDIQEGSESEVTISELPLFGVTGFDYFDNFHMLDDDNGGRETLENNTNTYICCKCSGFIFDNISFCGLCSQQSRMFFCEGCVSVCEDCDAVFCEDCFDNITLCDGCNKCLTCPSHIELVTDCNECDGKFCEECTEDFTCCAECDEEMLCETCATEKVCKVCNCTICKKCLIVCNDCSTCLCKDCFKENNDVCICKNCATCNNNAYISKPCLNCAKNICLNCFERHDRTCKT